MFTWYLTDKSIKYNTHEIYLDIEVRMIRWRCGIL